MTGPGTGRRATGGAAGPGPGEAAQVRVWGPPGRGWVALRRCRVALWSWGGLGEWDLSEEGLGLLW